MATQGSILAYPEAGWVRHEDSSNFFNYLGTWNINYNSAYSGGSRHATPKASNGSVSFTFKGTGLRIIGSFYPSYSSSIRITIDGLNYYFSQAYLGANKVISFEKKDLKNKEHQVTMQKSSNGTYSVDFILDAVDTFEPELEYKHLLYKDGKYGYLINTGESGDLIPKMTSNVEEYGIAFASSEFTVNLTDAYKAFNKTNERDAQDNWFSAYQEGNSGKSYIGYDFKRKVNVSKLKLVTPNRSDTPGLTATIDGFDFEGWTGSEWEKIQNFYYPSSSVNVALYEKELEVNNEKEYSKYRLNNLKSINQRNNTYGVAIGEIVMYGGGIKFVSLGSSLPTDEQFEQFGVEDLTEWLPFINEIQGEKKIITKASKPLVALDLEYIPEPQFVKQKDSITINKELIDSLTINEGQTKGNIRVAAQFPDVDSYSYVFKDSTWSKIDTADANVFSSNGNTIDEMNAADWSTSPLLEKVRFIYSMKMNNLTDSIILSSIDIKLKGITNSSPFAKNILGEIKAYTLNGYMNKMEELNSLNFAKLEFKSDSIIKAKKNNMHEMIIDVLNEDTLITYSSDKPTNEETITATDIVKVEGGYAMSIPIEDKVEIKSVP